MLLPSGLKNMYLSSHSDVGGNHDNGKVLLCLEQTLDFEDETGLHEAQLCLYDQCRKYLTRCLDFWDSTKSVG